MTQAYSYPSLVRRPVHPDKTGTTRLNPSWFDSETQVSAARILLRGFGRVVRWWHVDFQYRGCLFDVLSDSLLLHERFNIVIDKDRADIIIRNDVEKSWNIF